MLLEFEIDNWKSYRNKALLSMMASREKQHPTHLSRLERYGCSVLPVSAIFGGNASGKSNFFSAIEFAQRLIIDGRKPQEPIRLNKFALDDESQTRPVRFMFKILADDIGTSINARKMTLKKKQGPTQESIYVYSFSLTEGEVIEEMLVKINPASEKTLFARKAGAGFSGHFFEASVLRDRDGSPIDPQRIKCIGESTRKNQLFLTNTHLQNLDILEPIYDWFARRLVLINSSAPYRGFSRYFDQNDPLREEMEELLDRFDTGITHLEARQTVMAGDGSGLDRLIDEGGIFQNPGEMVVKEGGKLVHKQLLTSHYKKGGQEVLFELSNEADGTKRLFEILPALIESIKPDSQQVFVIDELGRSFHCDLTRRLIEYFLIHRPENSRAQLLATTHDISMFSQEVFRRDEIWLTERLGMGETNIFSLCEYKQERKDSDIQKGYLIGHFGGIPSIPVLLS